MGVSKTSENIKMKIKISNPSEEPPASSNVMIMGQSKTSEHIKITTKMPNPSQEPPVSSKSPNEDLKDMDVLCTFKIKIESQNIEYGCIKEKW